MTRQIDTRSSLDALQRVRADGAAAADAAATPGSTPAVIKPNPKAKFEAKGVEGDITKIVGGASDKPLPAMKKTPEQHKADQQAGGMNSLMEAKRRAQQMIKDREQ
jgi:hypothetical protein